MGESFLRALKNVEDLCRTRSDETGGHVRSPYRFDVFAIITSQFKNTFKSIKERTHNVLFTMA